MKQTHRSREQHYLWGKGRREGQYRARRVRGTTIKYKICYEDILYNTGNIGNIL